MINEERLGLALTAMEPGKYIKGTSFLHQVDVEGVHRQCCLGVLSMEAIANGLDISREMIPASRYTPEIEIFAGRDDEDLLCPEVADWYGLEQCPALVNPAGKVIAAASWNDWGPDGDILNPRPEEDFTEIAAGFRRTFLEGK